MRSALRRRPVSGAEASCVLGFVALVVTAIAAPSFEQPQDYHAFADARAWAGVPNAANVLSNAVFVVAGVLVGATALSARARLGAASRAGVGVTAIGLLLTAAGSAYYHWRPDDATLAWDRLPLAATFAGLIVLVLAQRVSERLAWAALPTLVVLASGSVFYWRVSGNLMPYAVLQVGAMVALLLIVALLRRPDDTIPWWWLIAGYTLAKLAELYDGRVLEASGALSGHTLKHLLAGLAAAGLAWPLLHPRR